METMPKKNFQSQSKNNLNYCVHVFSYIMFTEIIMSAYRYSNYVKEECTY